MLHGGASVAVLGGMLCKIIGSPRRVLPFVEPESSVEAAAATVASTDAEWVVVESVAGLSAMRREELLAYARQVPAFKLADLPLRGVVRMGRDATMAEITAILEDAWVPAVAMCDGQRIVVLVTRLEVPEEQTLKAAA